MRIMHQDDKRLSPKGSVWNTPGLAIELDRLYGLKERDYLSADQIAKTLNKKFKAHNIHISRSAVISRAKKQGLTTKYTHRTAHAPGGVEHVERMSRQRGSTIPATSNGRNGAFVRKVREGLRPRVVVPMPKPLNLPTAPEGGVALLDATDQQCRWPMADKEGVAMCCGNAIFRKSYTRPGVYCAVHCDEGTDHGRTAQALERNNNDVHRFGMRRKRTGLGANKFT